MANMSRTEKSADMPAPTSSEREGPQHEHEVAAAEAAVAVDRTLAAVAAARALTADAAAHAIDDRMMAGRAAEKLVAEAAVQDAVATQSLAEDAAALVRTAAEQAAAYDRRSASPGDPRTLERAARTAATVEAAAAAVRDETTALASLVAQAVATTAEWVAITRLALERTIAADVADTAAAVEVQATTAAHRAAEETADRLALDESKSELLATVIHELRTPMTSISAYTELLQDSDVTVKQLKHLDAIERSAHRLTALVDDLLTLFNLEQATAQHDYTDVDVCAAVTAAESASQVLIDAKPVDLTFEVPSTPLLVRGDARDLECLVSNLVSNAVKFTDAGGWVRCSVQQTDRWARLEVSDNGIGIPESEQQLVFTRFFRSSTALDHAIPGTGLGLAIVRAIVNRHGGTISIVSAEQRGTTVTVDLPLRQVPPEPNSTQSSRDES